MRGRRCLPRKPRIVFAITENVCRASLVFLEICNVSSVLDSSWAQEVVQKKQVHVTDPIPSGPREELVG